MMIIGVKGQGRIRSDGNNDRLYCRFMSRCMALLNAQLFQKQGQHIYCMVVESVNLHPGSEGWDATGFGDDCNPF